MNHSHKRTNIELITFIVKIQFVFYMIFEVLPKN